MDRQYLLSFDVAYPARHKRWLLFFRGLLIIPHIIALWFLAMAMNILTFLAWFAILFTGRYPEGLWSFNMSVVRWAARVQVYVTGLRDDYPPFGDESYPITFALHRPQRQSRLLIFFRPLLVIPHYFCLMFVFLAAYIVYFVAWLSVLVLGRMPRGMFNFLVGTFRWTFRVQVYYLMLTDTYPPFSHGGGQASVAAGGTPVFANA